MEQFMMSPQKWGLQQNWGCAPAPASSRHWTYDAIGWTDVHRKSVKVKVNTLCMGNFRLPPACLVYYPTERRVPRLFLYRKLLRFMALRVKLVIFANAFMAGSTLWWVFCLSHVVLRAQLFVKVGVRPRALWFRTQCLGHSPSVMV